MEDNNQTPDSSTAPTPGKIIDVQVSPSPEQTSNNTSFIPTVEADESPMPETSPTQEVTEAPTQQDSEPAPEVSSDDSQSPQNQNQPLATPGHKTKTPVAAIIAAVVVALGLIGITVYAYTQSQEKVEKPSTSQSQEQAAPNVSGQDVDKTSADVDQALGAQDEADFPETELTDQSLGL